MAFKRSGLWACLGVFGIIALHKTMVWQSLIDEWNQSVLKNVAIQIGMHYSFKNTNFHGATPTDASPDKNLKRVFRFWLSLCWFIDFSITCVVKLLRRDGTSLEKMAFKVPPESRTRWVNSSLLTLLASLIR